MIPSDKVTSTCPCWWCNRSRPVPPDANAAPVTGVSKPANGLAGVYRAYVRQWHIDRMRPSELRSYETPLPSILDPLDEDEYDEEGEVVVREPFAGLVWTTDPQAKSFDASNTLRWERALFDEARSPIVAFQGWMHSHTKLVPDKPDPREYLVTGPFEAPTGWKRNPGFGTVRPRRVTVQLDGSRGYLPHPLRRWSNDSLIEEYGMGSKEKELHIWSKADKRWLWETRTVYGWVHRDWRMRGGLDGYPPREAWLTGKALVAYVERNNAHARMLRQRDRIVAKVRYFGQDESDPEIASWIQESLADPVKFARRIKELTRRFHEQQQFLAAEAEALEPRWS